jgi:hypothetical protein
MPKSDERGSPGPRECICSFPHGDKGFRAFEMLENIEFSLKWQTNGVLVTLPGLVVSKASLPKGSAGFPCCPTSGPLQGPLYRTQLPVRHIAHHLAGPFVVCRQARVFLWGKLRCLAGLWC